MGESTSKLNLYKPDPGPPGEEGWGEDVNQNFDTLDNALVNNSGLVETGDATFTNLSGSTGRIGFFNQVVFGYNGLTVESNEIEWPVSVAPVAYVILDDDAELKNPTGGAMAASAVFVLVVIQDNSGNHELTFDSDYRFPGGVPPVITTDPDAYDILTFIRLGDGSMNVVAAHNFLPEEEEE